MILICFIYLQINELPKPAYMQKSLRDLKIGTYDNIETADETTSIITALKKFVERRVSALPLVDAEGRLVDIYAKFDVIVSNRFKKQRRRKIISIIFCRISPLRRPTTISMSRCARRTSIATSGSRACRSAIWTSHCTRLWSALCVPRCIVWL